ncbi:MAG: bifunctional homocysteine S-methyltransferase/methylenetetrahydrofolate reductase [Dehalococcoidia bacterium]
MENGSGSFLERLERGPVLGDGAVGTQLYARGGVTFDRCFDELNLSQPELVREIHLDYIRAGAEVIETNTFGANRFQLAAYGLATKVREINRQGVLLAREARNLGGRQVWIAGALGPLGKLLAPVGPLSAAHAREAFQEQAQSLMEAGVDLLILETFSDLREMREAVLAVQEMSDLPLIAQMTFTEDGTTAAGDSPAEIVRTLEELKVPVIGANCSVGSHLMLRVMEEMAQVSHTPLSAQPNAGFPAYVRGRFFYLSSPEYMAEHARRMVELGVSLVGGCCGTTPKHTAAMGEGLQGLPRPPSRVAAGTAVLRERETPPPPPSAAERPTRLAAKLGREFVVTVEVNPPKGFDISDSLVGLDRLNESGLLDAVNVADSSRAQARMSALATCSLIQNRLGMETILHLATRHRNLVALHSELLGAHALGVRNIFAVMGDLPRIGDYPDATAVSDITASGLIRLVKSFNQGIGLTGRPLERPTSFFVGCALNMGADDLDRELRVLERKLEAGADFILTQPVYSPEVVERCWRRLGGFPVPVIMGVLPLRSSRHAEFLHNEVPGISVPEEVRQRMREAGDRSAEVGMALTLELVESVRDKVAGVYCIPPFERYEVVLEVLEGLKAVVPGLHAESS